jgi:hypothetical protein
MSDLESIFIGWAKEFKVVPEGNPEAQVRALVVQNCALNLLLEKFIQRLEQAAINVKAEQV